MSKKFLKGIVLLWRVSLAVLVASSEVSSLSLGAGAVAVVENSFGITIG